MTEGAGGRGAAASGGVRGRPARVMLGLLLSFVGILGLSLLLPIGSAALGRALLLLAGGAGALWAGGILLGIATPLRSRS